MCHTVCNIYNFILSSRAFSSTSITESNYCPWSKEELYVKSAGRNLEKIKYIKITFIPETIRARSNLFDAGRQFLKESQDISK